MDVQASSLFKELDALRLEARGTRATSTNSEVQQDFGSLLKSALENVNGLQNQTSELRTRFDMVTRAFLSLM